MARTPMARLPRLFRTPSRVLGINPIAADIIIFGIIKDGFLFYIDYCMLNAFIRIASMRRF